MDLKASPVKISPCSFLHLCSSVLGENKIIISYFKWSSVFPLFLPMLLCFRHGGRHRCCFLSLLDHGCSDGCCIQVLVLVRQMKLDQFFRQKSTDIHRWRERRGLAAGRGRAQRAAEPLRKPRSQAALVKAMPAGQRLHNGSVQLQECFHAQRTRVGLYAYRLAQVPKLVVSQIHLHLRQREDEHPQATQPGQLTLRCERGARSLCRLAARIRKYTPRAMLALTAKADTSSAAEDMASLHPTSGGWKEVKE